MTLTLLLRPRRAAPSYREEPCRRSRSIPTSTARSVRSSPQPISSSAKRRESCFGIEILQHQPSQGTRFHVVPSYATLTIQDPVVKSCGDARVSRRCCV